MRHGCPRSRPRTTLTPLFLSSAFPPGSTKSSSSLSTPPSSSSASALTAAPLRLPAVAGRPGRALLCRRRPACGARTVGACHVHGVGRGLGRGGSGQARAWRHGAAGRMRIRQHVQYKTKTVVSTPPGVSTHGAECPSYVRPSCPLISARSPAPPNPSARHPSAYPLRPRLPQQTNQPTSPKWVPFTRSRSFPRWLLLLRAHRQSRRRRRRPTRPRSRRCRRHRRRRPP